MSEWVVKNLDEVVEYFIDYRGKTPVKTGSGIPLITAKIVKDGCLQTPTEFISVEDYPLWMTRGYPEVNDVVLTTEAPLGEVALIKNKNVALAQRIITLRGYKNILDNKFLKYWLQSEQGQYELESRASGTTVFGIKSSILKKIPISLPPYNEQVAISSVLYSIDEKIDLLHRQNKTLESMAETIFRKWFIEEPQEEWDTVPLSKVATFTNGLACQKFPAISGEPSMPVLKIKELSSGISSNTDLATANIKEDYIVNHGDVIFAWSASLMVKIWSGPVCVLNQHLFKVTSDTYPKWFYLEWCKHYLKEFISISQSHATTMGHIKRKDLDEAMVKIPSNNELVNMTAKIGPLLDQRIEKMRQIRTLETLRDTLLPKLMSGDVRVQYAEEAIASVA
ncbi:restriction endonuclease subunit S [Klebsiella pneumoniae]|jgi:type I restriction enzyme S subunit|uniref:restriction endonuclease subunit S n=1 Tax=Klebsiella pneumoniae TaxID=573 RepID=UPI0006676A55|nr:restriction endonuclease subunit S [Klebsiella pneumoniae]EBW7293161.1 restriction endonuclease subunit S [Salmonella enterica subsp. enterica serovar Senftenberg]HBB9863632.1 restriction endonuclease subunit S [Escherichia coli]HDS7516994.1 restriction endonuclease subunit S [Klebsiella pneumoniae subsp. pneumoniae]MBS2084418.1 restriction endonuclease subunit S [Klebsiella pneumoniae]MCM5900389.1 restriction endonuclease subunit S [Klebsiella pneumoniae]